MKNTGRMISLAALALTASLLLGACGGNNEEKTSPASSRSSQVKPASSAVKPASSQSMSSSSQTSSTVGKESESNTVGSRTTQPAIRQNETVRQQEAAPAPAVRDESSSQYQPSQPAAQSRSESKLPSFEEGRKHAQDQAAQTQNARYKGVLAMAAGDLSAAAGSWEDGHGTQVTIGNDGSISIKKSEQEAASYSIGSYSYTLDDGSFSAQVYSANGDSANLQIITGADGRVSTVQVMK